MLRFFYIIFRRYNLQNVSELLKYLFCSEKKIIMYKRERKNIKKRKKVSKEKNFELNFTKKINSNDEKMHYININKLLFSN